MLKKTGKVDIGPSLIIPLMDLWKQDAIFPPETNSNSRNKWLGGFGVGIKLIYSPDFRTFSKSQILFS